MTGRGNVQSSQRTYRIKSGWPVIRFSYKKVTTSTTWTLAEGGYFFLLVERAIIATIVAAIVASKIPNWNIMFIASYVTIYTPPLEGVPTVRPLYAVAISSLPY